MVGPPAAARVNQIRPTAPGGAAATHFKPHIGLVLEKQHTKGDSAETIRGEGLEESAAAASTMVVSQMSNADLVYGVTEIARVLHAHSDFPIAGKVGTATACQSAVQDAFPLSRRDIGKGASDRQPAHRLEAQDTATWGE
eukprot:CAMPEP_0115845936 /NCGR_PEP_ID=MMETSP0287-20121206/9608_1 /TAXON_ID=412157 /ORGANISM="Chrysochromulina rotalis, Strain UIO044" /LENGTH=139 /DNA_ID=CAMNT_0003299723 /DNA_START=512 /DNA_END=932 /DNA_ORIENTATION=+